MSVLIVDTGPLVALLNKHEHHHDWARELFDTIEPPLFTCEAVIAESSFLLQRLAGGHDAVLELLSKRILRIDFRLEPEIEPVRKLMKKFGDVPMSLADACLVRMTELNRRSTVITLDGDFRVYRRNRRESIPVMAPDQPRKRSRSSGAPPRGKRADE